jgi:heptosyltransferase-2
VIGPDLKRLVIRAPNWLGDAVMALPAMAAVRAALPDTFIAVAAIPSISPLFHEDTIARPDSVVTLEYLKNERDSLRVGSFDGILLLPNSFRTAWIARRAFIPQRWGYAGNFRSPLLTRAIEKPAKGIHQAAYYLDLIRRLGMPAEDQLPRVMIRQHTAARAATLLEHAVAQTFGPVIPPPAFSPGFPTPAHIVGIAPGAAYGHAKRWPPARMAELVVRLTRERGATCVLLGATTDRDAGREIESSLPPDINVVNMIGRTSLREFAGVVARCHAFISNDSGGMHLAAAVGVPVAAIFGPTDERVTAPLGDHDVIVHPVFCRPCMLRDCPIDHRCMKGISVEVVFEAIARRLDARV